MQLPAEYLVRMEKRLGRAFPAFLRAYELPPVRGVRANTLKLSREALSSLIAGAGEPVAWAQDGVYYEGEGVGHLPAFHAGLLYAQEPSAMCAAPLLAVQPQERVLDLCAAPGGKTTQLAAAMRGEGVLVANEYVGERARILSQNVERLGVVNCAVVSAEPSALARQFPRYFDKILVDAPCSGEGMFRKDETARAEWSAENVARCVARGADILEAAATMLAGGGKLVFSTCTFEEGENEGQIAAFLARHPEFTLEEEHLLYPHEVRGEGHYAALLRLQDAPRGEAKPFPITRDRAAEEAWRAFEQDFLRAPLHGKLTTLQDGRMYLIPREMPALTGRVLRVGLELGKFEKRRFTPAHALAMAVRGEDVRRTHALTEQSVAAWLRGETLPTDMADGWGVALYRGFPLGLCKATGGVLKNHYPKGLRER